MSTTAIQAERDTVSRDKGLLLSIVKGMSKSMSGGESTKDWAADALWFDIPPFASKGVQPALKFFDKAFAGFRSYTADMLEAETTVNGDMGIVCRVQKISVSLNNGESKILVVRETDCFERRNGKWKLIHQHASVPAGGEWDGKIVTA